MTKIQAVAADEWELLINNIMRERKRRSNEHVRRRRGKRVSIWVGKVQDICIATETIKMGHNQHDSGKGFGSFPIHSIQHLAYKIGYSIKTETRQSKGEGRPQARR